MKEKKSSFCIPRLDEQDMKQFYEQKKHLAAIDATPLLSKCIEASYDSHPIYHRGLRDEDCWVEYSEASTFISTHMLMDKLDASLYMWRELNPTLVELLSHSKSCKIDTIANWICGVNYYAPLEVLKDSTNGVKLLGI